MLLRNEHTNKQTSALISFLNHLCSRKRHLHAVSLSRDNTVSFIAFLVTEIDLSNSSERKWLLEICDFWVPRAFLIALLCCSFESEVSPIRYAWRCSAPCLPLPQAYSRNPVHQSARPRTRIEVPATTRFPASVVNRNRSCDWANCV